MMPKPGKTLPNRRLKGPGSEHEHLAHLLNREPNVDAFYRSYTRRALMLCLIAIPVGIVMKLPVVWGLAMLGVAVAVYRLYFAKMGRN